MMASKAIEPSCRIHLTIPILIMKKNTRRRFSFIAIVVKRAIAAVVIPYSSIRPEHTLLSQFINYNINIHIFTFFVLYLTIRQSEPADHITISGIT